MIAPGHGAEQNCDEVDGKCRAVPERIVQLLGVGAPGSPVGRRLEFLLQELGREANTIGSKANDLDVGRLVVYLKSDVELLREQVQNLE